MFVLGIGKDVDTSELNKIASGPNNVFRVDSFEDLDDNADVIKRGICKFGTVCNVILSSISRHVSFPFSILWTNERRWVNIL